jgi:hypothetical protein
VASATIPVRTDGQWSGSLVVPAGTPPAEYVLAARCVYPGFDEFDPVVYAPGTFTVTGEGENAPSATGSALTAEAGSIEPLPRYEGSRLQPHHEDGHVGSPHPRAERSVAHPGSGGREHRRHLRAQGGRPGTGP